MGLIMGTLLAAAMCWQAPFLVSLFTKDPGVIQYAVPFMYSRAIAFPGLLTIYAAAGAFRGWKDTRWVTVGRCCSAHLKQLCAGLLASNLRARSSLQPSSSSLDLAPAPATASANSCRSDKAEACHAANTAGDLLAGRLSSLRLSATSATSSWTCCSCLALAGVRSALGWPRLLPRCAFNMPGQAALQVYACLQSAGARVA